MSLLQETHNQYASFTDTASCKDLNVSGTIFAPEITADVLAATTIFAPEITADSVVTPALQVTTAPAAGKVLTSDATGNATWQPLPAVPVTAVAYGYAVGQSDATVAAGGLITFDLGTVVNNVGGFTSVPATGGTTYIIATAGVYEYNFYVAAADGTGTTLALEIALEVNGALPGAQNIFRSGLAGADPDPMVCIGTGLITLAAADTVSLKNITNNSGTALNFTSVPVGGVAGANRTLSLKLIA